MVTKTMLWYFVFKSKNSTTHAWILIFVCQQFSINCFFTICVFLTSRKMSEISFRFLSKSWMTVLWDTALKLLVLAPAKQCLLRKSGNPHVLGKVFLLSTFAFCLLCFLKNTFRKWKLKRGRYILVCVYFHFLKI